MTSTPDINNIIQKLLDATIERDSSKIHAFFTDNYDDLIVKKSYKLFPSITEVFIQNQTIDEELNLTYLYENYLTYLETLNDKKIVRNLIAGITTSYTYFFSFDLTEEHINSFVDKLLAFHQKDMDSSFQVSDKRPVYIHELTSCFQHMANVGNSFYEQKLAAVTPIEIKTYSELYEKHMSSMINKMDNFFAHESCLPHLTTIFTHISRISSSKKEEFLKRIIDFDLDAVVDKLIKIDKKNDPESPNRYRIYIDPLHEDFQKILLAKSHVKQDIARVFTNLCNYNSKYNFLLGSKVINFNHQNSSENKDIKTPTIFCELHNEHKAHVHTLIRQIALDCLTDSLVSGNIINENYFDEQINPTLRDIHLFKELSEVKSNPIIKKKKI